MYNIKRISIFLAVAVVIMIIGASFAGENIMERAIIIGLGVDGSDEGVRVTAEIVSPTSSGEQIGTFSKTISANGKSVADAIARIAELTGKEASLGRCLLLVFGQEYYENTDLSNDVDYFINSDSFKESSSICCAEGSAEELFNKSSSLSQGISIELSAMFQTESKKTAVVTNTLLEYTLSQRELHKTGFLNRVSFIPSANKNPDEPDKPQGYFDLRNIVIFSQNKYVCMLNDDEMRGFALLSNDVIGSTFVTATDNKQQTVTMSSKKSDIKLNGDAVKCNVSLRGKVVRTDSAEVEGIFVSKDKKNLSQAEIDDIIAQATTLINALLDKQREYNFDIVNLHEKFRQRDGTSKELCALATEDITIEEVVVEFTEA